MLSKKQRKDLKKNLIKDTKILLKMEKIKIENVVLNDIRISQKLKSKGYLSIEKDIMKCKKIGLYVIHLFKKMQKSVF